jgi:hypothetical protein
MSRGWQPTEGRPEYNSRQAVAAACLSEHARCNARGNHPVLGSVLMGLIRQARVRPDLDALHLEASTFIE